MPVEIKITKPIIKPIVLDKPIKPISAKPNLFDLKYKMLNERQAYAWQIKNENKGRYGNIAIINVTIKEKK